LHQFIAVHGFSSRALYDSNRPIEFCRKAGWNVDGS